MRCPRGGVVKFKDFSIAHPTKSLTISNRDRDDTQGVQTDLFIVGNYVNSPVAGCALLPSSIEKGVKYIFHLFLANTEAY